MADNLLRECVSWLTRCGVLRDDHAANRPDATLQQLAVILRDGVVLCNLLYNLDSMSIDMREVNQKPQLAQFLCLRNIRTFINVCRDYFDIHKNDLFEPTMLFEFTDFFKVLYTLSKLSLCPKVQAKKNIKGFSVNPLKTTSQEDIYRSLNTNIGFLEPKWMHFTIKSPQIGDSDETVYEDLCYVKIPMQISTDTIEERDRVINELLESEKRYVGELFILTENFMKPLGFFLKATDFQIIFSSIKELHEIHKGFREQLARRIKVRPIIISDDFIAWKEKFVIYCDYFSNLPRARQKIKDLSDQDETLAKELNKCEQSFKGKFKLTEILQGPLMQRIFKYELFLKKLIHYTLPTHQDYLGLEKAKDVIVDIIEYTNEVQKHNEEIEIIRYIQDQICDIGPDINSDLKHYGLLLHQDDLRVKANLDQKYYAFMFAQAILLCKEKSTGKNNYSFKEIIYLKDYTLGEQDGPFQWYLMGKTENNINYKFHAKSKEKKEKWVKVIEDALDDIYPDALSRTDHKFQIHTFEKQVNCNVCPKLLKGCIFQGYKCDVCNIAVHKQCIANTGKCGITPTPQLSPRPPMDVAGAPYSDPSNWSNKWPDHENLSEYLWFVGEMERDRATNLLNHELDGTYLLRIRPQGPTQPNETIYALSLKTDNKVKHMKVYEEEVDSSSQYFLSRSRYFRNLVELITFYERNSLKENFNGLNVRLQWPYRKITAIAEYDFNPTESNQLPLKQGCQVIVLSKEGEQKGWWKGKIDGRIGFFPKHYVKEVSDTMSYSPFS